MVPTRARRVTCARGCIRPHCRAAALACQWAGRHRDAGGEQAARGGHCVGKRTRVKRTPGGAERAGQCRVFHSEDAPQPTGGPDEVLAQAQVVVPSVQGLPTHRPRGVRMLRVRTHAHAVRGAGCRPLRKAGLWMTAPAPARRTPRGVQRRGDTEETQHVSTASAHDTRAVQPSWRGARERAWRSTAAAGQ